MSHRHFLTLLVAGGLFSAAGCADPAAKTGTSGSVAPATGTSSSGDSLGSGVVASADGIQILGTDVDTATATERYDARRKLFERQSNWAQNELAKRLITREAEKAGSNLEQFLAKKSETARQASDADVKMFYNANLAQFKKQDGTTASFPEMKEKIKGFLDGQAKQALQQQYVSKLMEDNHAKVELVAPEPPTIAVSVDDDPFEGKADAPVTIVEFSDFQCPACGQAFAQIDPLLAKYEGKIKFVYRDFPLVDKHPGAFPAAVAGNCALAQSPEKYWAFHHQLFEHQHQLTPEDFKKYATESKLDMTKFAECLKDPKMADEVKKDMKDGESYGINSTPTFFVNGKIVTGSNVQEVSRLIDNELKRAGS